MTYKQQYENRERVKQYKLGSEGFWYSTLIDETQCNLAKQFLRGQPRVKTPKVHSYWLKHVIEKAMGQYISNGATIKAAIDLGIDVVVEDGDGPNGFIAVSYPHIRRWADNLAAIGKAAV